MKRWHEVGGRDDVFLPGDLPDLGRWKISELPLLEAHEIGGKDEFPTRGTFALAELLEDDREVYLAITEGLRDLIDEERGEEPVTSVAVEVDTAGKENEENTAPWRYTATVTPLGPPDGS